MFHYIVFALLAPLLACQGHYVRRTSLVLPEADGERCGTLGKGAELSVLVAGDSAAAGVGVDNQNQALVGYLTRELAKHYCVTWALAAQSGNTTIDLIERLTTIEGKQFDVVLISLGVNDVLSPLSAVKWSQQLRILTLLLQKQFQTTQIWFTSVPPMEHFPLLPHPLRWFLGKRAQAFNRSLACHVNLNKTCGLIHLSGELASNVNIRQGYKIEMDSSVTDADLTQNSMAIDGFHPSESLYKIWGVTAAKMIIKRLS
jgi:lysophospholipase L1-like esterase